MSTEDSPIDQTTAEKIDKAAKLYDALEAADIDLDDLPEREGTTRRELLQAAGLIGGGAVLGGSGLNSMTGTAKAQAAGTIGDGNEDWSVNSVTATSVDTDELQNAGDILLYRNDNSLIARLDPSTTGSPVQDSVDKVAAAGGGRIEYPGGVIQDPGPIVNENDVNHDCNRNTTIEITGAGNDGFVIDSNAATVTPNGNIMSVDIYGHMVIRHANGSGGNTGSGVVQNTSLQNSRWETLEVREWNGNGFDGSGSASYQNEYGHLHISDVDPDGQATPACFIPSGGASEVFNVVSVYPTQGTGSYKRAVQTSGGTACIGLLNTGGATGRVVLANTVGSHGLHIRHINHEPADDNGTLPRAVQSGGVKRLRVGSLTLIPTFAADYSAAYTTLGGRDYLGPIYEGTNVGTFTNGRVDVLDQNDTQVYEGESADVSNNSGGTLSPGVACLGDLTLVT